MTRLLHEYVTYQAEQRPEAVAVVLEEQQLTYAQLEQASNQLAHILREGGCEPGDRVCFLLPKSPAAIVALVGILKAGCMYVPLDPASPASRLAKVVTSSEPRWILCSDASAALLDELLIADVGHLSPLVGWMTPARAAGNAFKAAFSQADFAAYPATPLASERTADDGAHVLFTSGSTGTPKGVIVRHSSVVHFVDWATRYFGMEASDRNSGHSPLHFDLSTFDIFGTFAVGAQLHLVPPELNTWPHKLAAFIRNSALTHWFSVPSILNHMAKFNVVAPHDFPLLKRLLWCGETFPTPPLMYWMERLPHVTFTNLYGPTEATIASSFYTLPAPPHDETTPIPIGTACPGEELLILDETLAPVAPDTVGDLYIGGAGLSPGYWRDQEKTDAAFVFRPGTPRERIYKTGDLASVGDDKLVHFHGRSDAQIKSRGYRIELGEIETALNAVPTLAEGAVVAIASSGMEGSTICCAYVPAPDATVTPKALRKALSSVLPTYMLPARWMAFAGLPKNVNGKIDRRALRERFAESKD